MPRAVLASFLALLLSGCAGKGSAPPEMVTGGFELVRVEGCLGTLRGSGAAPREDGCAPAGHAGSLHFAELSRTFHLSVRQDRPGPGAVRREESGSYVRRGEHLAFDSRLSRGGRVRFRGTTTDSTVTVRLTGAELHFRRVRPRP